MIGYVVMPEHVHLLVSEPERAILSRPFRHSILKAYIQEAVAAEKAGLKVQLKKHSDYVIPEELQKKLDAIPALKTAFEALTPGRQRAYMFHIAKPKQSKTRESTVEKCIPLILAGKGLND